MSTYYVDPDGIGGSPSDANSGLSTTTPWRTLAHSVPQLVGGDTLRLRAATYIESISNPGIRGTSWSNLITIVAYTGETVWIKPPVGFTDFWIINFQNGEQYVELDGINLDTTNANTTFRIGGISIFGSTQGSVPPSHHIRFKNAEIIGNRIAGDVITSPVGITLNGGEVGFNEILNTTIHGGGGSNSYYGLYIHSSDNVVDGCNVYDMGLQGMQIFTGTSPQPARNIIRNSRWHDIAAAYNSNRNGILVAGDDNLVYNNIIYNINTNDGGNGAGIVSYTGSNNKFLNNTVYGVHGEAFQAGGVTNSLFGNNIAYSNSLNDVHDYGATSLTKTTNLFGTDPSFVDASSANFHLAASSVARDAGTTYTDFGIDFDGIARPQGSAWDIGAYEYSSLGVVEAVAPGSYTMTGTAVTFRIASPVVITAGSGSYTYTGTAATLVPPDVTLTADASSYTYTGTSATVGLLNVVADAGTYDMTGTDATLVADTNHTLAADTDSYVMIGTGAAFVNVNYTMPAATIAYAMTGTSAVLGEFNLSADASSYSMIGTDVTLTAATSQTATVAAGSYLMTGTAVSFTAPTVTTTAQVGHGRRMKVPVIRTQGPHSIKVPVNVEGAPKRVVVLNDGEGYTHR